MSLAVFQLSIIRLLQYDWLSGYWRVMNTVTCAIETRFLNIYSTFLWPLMNECILNIIVVFASDLILTSRLNGLNWRLPIGWWYPGGHMTKRRGCQGQFESDSHGAQLNFNMFYNLRLSPPKAYAIMHKRGLISLPSVAEVEEPGNDSHTTTQASRMRPIRTMTVSQDPEINRETSRTPGRSPRQSSCGPWRSYAKYGRN